MIKVRQAVIVEGKYDKAKLSALVDTTILTTGGFNLYRNPEKLALIRRLAEKDGIIILTDSDAAGFQIRGYLSGAIDPANITHVYIPDLFGKEHRKAHPSAEGKLGVEGVSLEILLAAFARAGIFPDGEIPAPTGDRITKADFAEWGLSGGQDSAARRRLLQQKLNLPARMSANALLSAVNALYSREEFSHLLEIGSSGFN